MSVTRINSVKNQSLELLAYPYCDINDFSYRERFRTEVIDEAGGVLKFCLNDLYKNRVDAPFLTISIESDGNGHVRYRIIGNSLKVCHWSSVLQLSKRHLEFNPSAGEMQALPTERVLARRVHSYDIARGTRLRHMGVRTAIPGFTMADSIPIEYPMILALEPRSNEIRWENVALALSSSETPAAIRFNIRQALEDDLDKPGLETAVKKIDEGIAPLYPLDTKEKLLAAFRNLYTNPERFWMACTLHGKNVEILEAALRLDTNPSEWSNVPKNDTPNEISRQLNYLWSIDELIGLLCPPYSCQNALRGLKANRVRPFDEPPIIAVSDQKSSICIGSLDSDRRVWLPTSHMNRGFFIGGVPRSGKSVTGRFLVNQLMDQGVKVLVIDPAGIDWLPFMKSRNGQVYGYSGNYDRFGFCGFLPVGRHTVRDHIRIVARAFALTWSTTEFGLDILVGLVRNLYLSKRLDVEPNIKIEDIEECTASDLMTKELIHTIPTVQDFLDEYTDLLAAVLRGYDIREWREMRRRKSEGEEINLGISPKSRELRDSMIRRKSGLEHSALYKFMSAPAADPYRSFGRLLESNVLFQLSGTASIREATGVSALIVSLLHAVRLSEAESSELKHALVIEEAHNLVPATGRGRDDNILASPQQEAADTVSRVMLECPKYGQMTMLIDQMPSEMQSAALKAVSYYLTHRLVDEGEREKMGFTMGLEAAQRQSLGGLDVGQGVAYLDGHVALLRTPSP